MRIFCWLLILLLSIGRLHAQDILATTTFLADITRQVTGEALQVESLLPSGADPHIYEAVPADAARIATAQVIVRNGLNLEGWLDKLVAAAGNRKPIITAASRVLPIRSEVHEDSYDPHAWMDPYNGLLYAEVIAEELTRIYPDKKEIFDANLQIFKEKIKLLDRRIQVLVKSVPKEKRIIITSHDAFRYFANRYGFKVQSILGTTTDADVQLSDMKQLRALINKLQVPAIFIESTINPKLMEQVAQDEGIVIGGKLYADALGPKGSPQATYLGMIEADALVITGGLSKNNPVSDTSSKDSQENPVPFLIGIGIFFLAAFGFVAWKMKMPPTIASFSGMLSVRGLRVAYERRPVLQNFNLEIKPGLVYGLLGPNGSGKSTLLKAILGLIPVQSGSVRIGGYPIQKLRPMVAYVPQREEIDWDFPATVLDVVLMGRYPHKRVFQPLNREDQTIALATLERLGLKGLEHRSISALSGGQQQRVFIARALCQQAHVYLFDEPFVGVDATTEERIIRIIKEMAADGHTVIIVHHDLSKVPQYFDEVILINRRLVASGPVSEVFTPELIQRTFSGVPDIMASAEEIQKK